MSFKWLRLGTSVAGAFDASAIGRTLDIAVEEVNGLIRIAAGRQRKGEDPEEMDLS